jgi:uncharacterized membrane protein
VTQPANWPSLPDRSSRGVAVALAFALFLASWALLHTWFWDSGQIVDTGVYEEYGEAVSRGEVPYRDFDVEYPPAALPVFVLPALGGGEFVGRFELVMLLCGLAVVAFAALAGARAGSLALIGISPLLLGSLVLSRYDLWPAALSVVAVAAAVRGRRALAGGVLGLAVAAKLYPLVLLPLFARHAGQRAVAAFAAVVAACWLPFVLLAPGGVADSLARQLGRPLQIESLGSSLLLALGADARMQSSHGSQNLAGTLPDAVALVTSVVQLAALAAVWVLFARGPATRDRLLVASAASVCAFVAFGKVLSPQFLIWLVPLVPLVGGAVAPALLVAALVLTQLEFPRNYWDLALHFDGDVVAIVLARNLVLVALTVILARRLLPGTRDRK